MRGRRVRDEEVGDVGRGTRAIDGLVSEVYPGGEFTGATGTREGVKFGAVRLVCGPG